MSGLPDDLARLSVEERRALLVQMLQKKLASGAGAESPAPPDNPPVNAGPRPFTVASLAEAIDSFTAGKADAAPEAAGPELAADATLEPDIVPSGPADEAWLDPRRVLLTGATGFLGAFVLRELADQTRATVHCLVRAGDAAAGMRRIKETLASYGLWDESLHGRVVPVPGNLARPRLGLNDADFEFLSDRLDAVYHVGAIVNFLASYEALRATNVHGTREVLRLACRKRPAAVHFVSTLAMLPVAAFGPNRAAPELDHLDNTPPVSSGYAQSKWAADKLVLAARDRGLPATVYRPGLVTGHSVTGAANPDDTLTRALQAVLMFRLAPSVDVPIDMTPVDYVSRAVVYLSRQRDAVGKAFHLANPRPMPWGRVLAALRDRGYAVEEVPYNVWQGFMAGAAASGNNPMALLSPLFPQLSGGEGASLAAMRFDCRRTEAALAPVGIRCPAIDDELIGRYAASLGEPSGALAAK